MCFLIVVQKKTLKAMINLIIIFALSVLVVVFAVTCLMLKADVEDLKRSLSRMNELYRQESDRNIEKLAEEVFRDDMEILNRFV